MCKPFNDFHRATGMRDGHRSECKDCSRTARRRNYESNRDAYIRRAQEWKRRNSEKYREMERSDGRQEGPRRVGATGTSISVASTA